MIYPIRYTFKTPIKIPSQSLQNLDLTLVFNSLHNFKCKPKVSLLHCSNHALLKRLLIQKFYKVCSKEPSFRTIIAVKNKPTSQKFFQLLISWSLSKGNKEVPKLIQNTKKKKKEIQLPWAIIIPSVLKNFTNFFGTQLAWL